MIRKIRLTPARCCAKSLIQQTVSSGFYQHHGIKLHNCRFTDTYAAPTHAPRGRAAAPTGARSASAIAARSSHCAPAISPSRTPARWPAKMIGGQRFGVEWVGGCVPIGNALEQSQERLSRWNCLAISPVLAVPRFWGDTYMRAHTHAYMCEGNAGTLEHSNNLYGLQRVSCSFAVLRVFSIGTGRAPLIGGLGAVHILAGGYALGAVPGACRVRIRGQNLGLVAESFRVFGRAAGQLGGDRSARGNGGILPFSRGSMGAVGRVALEGWAQGADWPAVSGSGRKPSRLRAMPGRADRAGSRAAPPVPPARPRDPLPCCRSRLAGFGSAIRPAALPRNIAADQAPAVRGRAKSDAAMTGRGGVWGATHAEAASTGRGGPVRSSHVGKAAPGWICDAKAGCDYVN